MDLDTFTAVARSPSKAIHNVQLLDVQQSAEGGYELLTIEHAGTTRQLPGGGRWNEQSSRREVGKFGCIVPVSPLSHNVPAGSFYFRSYMDQSLRRVPELDSAARASSGDGRVQEVVGWYCSDRPHGFLAPVGIIPGECGRFVPDATEVVTLRVPPEFLRECRRVQMTAEELLRSFVGDLAGIQNYVANPRADGYGSNGSDERDYANAWLQRAHGMNAIDLDEVAANEEAAQEREDERDDFAALLDDYKDYGGNAQELFAAVQALVNAQQAKDSE